jgi:hypothetical protein
MLKSILERRSKPDNDDYWYYFNKKRLLLPLLLSAIALILYIAARFITEKSPDIRKDQSQPAVTPTVVPYQNPIPRNPGAMPYLINRTNTLSDVVSYTWSENILIYSTPGGIYRGGSNQILFEGVIDYINFNKEGEAVFKSDNGWYLFKNESAETINLETEADSVMLNKNADILSYVYADNIITRTPTGKGLGSIQIPQNTRDIKWIYDKNLLAINFSKNNERNISIYDKDLVHEITIKIPNNATFLDVTANGRYISYRLDNKIVLKNTDNFSEVHFEFNEKRSLKGNFIDNRNFIAIETTPVDSIGRLTNYIYRLKPTGNITYLSNTNPIPNKIDTDVYLKSNASGNVVPLVEIEGKIWLMSLVAGDLPFYTENGVTLVDQEYLAPEKHAP